MIDRIKRADCDWCDDGFLLAYGKFPGGDPCDFHLDFNVATPEEIHAWEMACAAFQRSGMVPEGPSFGLGTFKLDCPFCEEKNP